MPVDLDARDSVTAAWSDPAEHLRIKVDQLARAFALVADDRRSWLEPVEPSEALAPEDRIHRTAGQPRLPGEDVRADAQLASPRAQTSDELGRVATSLAMDRARAVDQEPDPGPVPPLRAGLAADASRSSRGRDRPSSSDPIGQESPPMRRESGIRMRHEGPFFDCGFDTNSRTIGALSPSTT
jgi:hypothetical protein